MDNITLLCLFGLVVLFVVLILPRLMNFGDRQAADSDERPHYDDPRIEGSGSFGRPQEDTRKDSPAIQPNRPVDDENISGRGSFGRDKKD